MFKKLSFLLLFCSIGFYISVLFFHSQPSQAGCGCAGSSCTGNMNIAQWGPANYVERPIYPMRGCGPNGCQKGWRSAIITPPPTAPYGGQVYASPPIGCGAPVGCSAPIFQPCAVPYMAPPPPCGCGGW